MRAAFYVWLCLGFTNMRRRSQWKLRSLTQYSVSEVLRQRMGVMAKDNQLYQLAAEQGEVFKRVRNGSLSIEKALVGIQGVIEGVYPSQYPPLWFYEPEQQVERVTAFLDHYDVVVSIPRAPYFKPRTSTEVIMVAIRLSSDDIHHEDSIWRNHRAWWEFIRPQNNYEKSVWERYTNDADHIRMVDSIKYHAGIRWIGFDPEANKGRTAKSCWNDPRVASTLASDEVLMAAAIFDKWVPDCNMSGYQFCDENNRNMFDRQLCDENNWDMVPCITAWDVPGQLKLCAYPANFAKKARSNPTVREL